MSFALSKLGISYPRRVGGKNSRNGLAKILKCSGGVILLRVMGAVVKAGLLPQSGAEILRVSIREGGYGGFCIC